MVLMNKMISHSQYLVCELCHLDRSLNVEIYDEYQMISVLVFLTFDVKFILGHLQELEQDAWLNCITCAICSFFLHGRKQKNKQIFKYSKFNSNFNTQRPVKMIWSPHKKSQAVFTVKCHSVLHQNKRFLPRANTTTAWRFIPHGFNISKN